MKPPKEHRTPSQAQIDANRRNAQKSTGPRSQTGKDTVGRNRLVHGLRAMKNLFLPDEDPAEFDALHDDLIARLQPVGPCEEKLVLRIAGDQWRLDRALPIEAGIYRERLRKIRQDDARYDKRVRENYEVAIANAEYRGEPKPPEPEPEDFAGPVARAFDADCAGANALTKLARYESALERSIDRCLRQLKNRQTARAALDQASQTIPAESPVDLPEPSATPSNEADCHSNPNPGAPPPQNQAPRPAGHGQEDNNRRPEPDLQPLP